MEFKKFDRQNLKVVRKLIDDKFAELEKETGIKFAIKSMSFSDSKFSTKLEGEIAAMVETNQKEEFGMYCSLFGLTPQDYKAVFSGNGKTYTIERIDPKKYKMPIIVSCSDGHEYKMKAEDVVRGLKRSVAPNSLKLTPLPLSPEMKEKFLEIAAQLSPENLTCDGELPKKEVNRRRSALRKQWYQLENAVGRRVDESEVW